MNHSIKIDGKVQKFTELQYLALLRFASKTILQPIRRDTKAYSAITDSLGLVDHLDWNIFWTSDIHNSTINSLESRGLIRVYRSREIGTYVGAYAVLEPTVTFEFLQFQDSVPLDNEEEQSEEEPSIAQPARTLLDYLRHDIADLKGKLQNIDEKLATVEPMYHKRLRRTRNTVQNLLELRQSQLQKELANRQERIDAREAERAMVEERESERDRERNRENVLRELAAWNSHYTKKLQDAIVTGDPNRIEQFAKLLADAIREYEEELRS